MTRQYDAIIIGSGQGAHPLANRLAAEEGLKTALIEKNKLGGTCVNVGCSPSKTLIASARAAHMARRGGDFGVITGEIHIDMKTVRHRVESRVNDARGGLERWLEDMENLDVIYGVGEFESERTVRVNGDLLEADRIFVSTGASASAPPIKGLDQINYMTNADVFQLDSVPEHLIVIGGSYIGLEIGQAFRRFGSEVTIFEAGSRLISREDEDVSEAVKEIMENEGIDVRTDTQIEAVSSRGDAIVVHLAGDGADDEVVGSHLLVATGRRPNSNIGLDKAGVEVDERGYIIVNDRLETNVPGIWAIGDVNGRGAFTHTSYNDFEILEDILFGSDTRRLSDRILTYALFIDPPLGRVGMTEQGARDTGREILVGKRPMTWVGRALEKDETQGFMKFLVDAESERILGAAILGVGGDEIISGITNVMYADVPYTVISRSTHIHPTVAELIPYTLADMKPLE